jgi:mannose-6-phosphate isomerase-like protein (cupin superfamily)
MQPHGKPIVLLPGEGETIDLGNFEMSVKATGAETRGLFSLLEAAEPPNFGPPMHIHHDCFEAFSVLEGEYRIFIEGAEHRCPAGSFVLIPSGLRHGFRVGGIASRKLNLYVPAEMIGYFQDLSAAMAKGNADPPTLDDIARRHGMDVVGPVPKGYL